MRQVYRSYSSRGTLRRSAVALILLSCCLSSMQAFQINSPVNRRVSLQTFMDTNRGKARILNHQANQAVANPSSDLAEPLKIAEKAITLFGFNKKPTPYDWSFIDAVYLITCPNADPGSERLNSAKEILAQVNLLDKVQIKEFETDDEDRIRGCYTSHISVLKDALQDQGEESKEGSPLQQIFKILGQPDQEDKMAATRAGQKQTGNILVFEDNLALSGGLQQSLLDSVADYTMSGTPWDMIHLSYIPYVPNLVVSRTDNEQVVKLSCGLGSALGTTAYIINKEGMKAVIQEDAEQGYYAPIPDVMAKLFPESRYAAFPTPFVRAPSTKSLVNPRLDDLREVLFRPAVASQAQNLLAQTGLSTNALLPITIVILLIGTVLSAKSSVWAAWSVLTTGSYDGPLILPVLSSAFTLFSLAILAQGAMLAPKPSETSAAEAE